MPRRDNPRVRLVDVSTAAQEPGASEAAAPLAEPEIVDVWSRTAPRYRARAIGFLSVNVAVFFALCCFTYWLRTGDLQPVLRPFVGAVQEVAPVRYDYWALWKASFNPFAEQQVTLTDFLLFPISIQQVPAQILIVGLLMASLVTIPISVAMLYRLPGASLFLVAVAFVAVFPWLALTLLLSCWIARARSFRFAFRYATLLLALIPVIIYFYTSTRGVSDTAMVLAGPMDRMKLLMPWIVAIIAACLGGGIVLLVAYLSNYRPGGVAPVLVVLFAVPVGLFHQYVGTDELRYRLLEHDYGPNSGSVFVDMDTQELIKTAAEKDWIAGGDKSQRELKAIMQNKQAQLNLMIPTELARQQQAVVEACTHFNDEYPDSRYRWNCLYLLGRALDMRIDMPLLRSEALLQFYSDFPSEASRKTWMLILGESPESPFASVAGLKLAKLASREGKLKLAEDILERVVAQFGAALPPVLTTAPKPSETSTTDDRFSDPLEQTIQRLQSTSPATSSKPAPQGLWGLLSRSPAASTLGVDPEAVAEQAAQLLSLIRENQQGQFVDRIYPENNPISMLLRCDPRHELYPENLRHISQWFPESKLQDNLRVRLALTERDVSERRKRLSRLARSYPKGDAAPHALYELGALELNQGRKEAGIRALMRVLTAYPKSPYALSARRKLMSIDASVGVR